MTYREKVNLFKNITAIVSLSVVVFIRRRIGFRLLDSGWYVLAAIAVGLIALFTYDPGSRFPRVMFWYALGILVFGAVHRAIAWFQFRRGTQPHSYSTGISIFELLPIPRFLRGGRAMNAVFDPFAIGITGIVVRERVFEPLGNWLMFSAICLFLSEIFMQAHAVNRDMDVADGLVTAGVQAEAAKRFEGVKDDSGADSGVPVPTGLGRDIRRKLNRK